MDYWTNVMHVHDLISALEQVQHTGLFFLTLV